MSDNNHCNNRRESIAALVLGELEADAAEELKEHISTCQTCRSLYQDLSAEEQTIKSAFATITNTSSTLQHRLVHQYPKEPHPPSRRTITLNLNAIVKSPITKLAAAAVIIIAVFWGLSLIGGPDMASITWADIREAFSRVEGVHVVQSMVEQDGEETAQGDFWFKRPTFFRQERRDGAMLIIDTGDRRLIIDRTHQRYQFSDPRPTPTHALFNWLGFLQGEETLDDSLFAGFEGAPILETVPAKSTDDTIVYEVNSPTATIEKVWVHRATGLVEKLIWTEVTTSGSPSEIRVKRGTTKFVLTFDYEPIPDEMFAVAPHEDYTEWYVPLLGKVIDQGGIPVAGAVVYAWKFGSLHEVTDRGGQWEIKLLPHLDLPAPPAVIFPIFLWAFRTDDPNWVAWTVIEDPNDKRTPAGTVPGEVTEIEVLEDNGYNRFAGGAGITLEMEPAVKLFGRVTDDQGDPIAGADVRVRGWRLADENANPLYAPVPLNYGPAGAKTDADGWYVLGNLPRLWPRSSIRIRASKSSYRDFWYRYELAEPLKSKEFNITLAKDNRPILVEPNE